ncbi:FecR family protein [Dinghuibacter silviterrae]|uniref:FecR family protein n=1 Tax=Dinghuibacter silviterrae TaxID=1539049 RepID=A0A4R8DHA3_9BACT|nr:FecR family protein [Dinghuibacter silviterrae]TDW97091.1 FecR family protein [Dinghuibacter silviterrae]
MTRKKIHTKEEAADSMKELVLNQLNNTSADDELLALLEEWMQSHPEDREAFDRLKDPAKLRQQLIRLRRSENSTHTSFRNMMRRIEPAPQRIPTIAWYLSGAAAAAVIFFLVFRDIRGVVHTPVPTPVAQVRDIPPGSNRAILTLSNGSSVTLSSQASLNLSQGAARLTSQPGGLLAYESKGSANEPVLYNTVSTPRACQYVLQLSDGTKVWLDAASSLRYPVNFTGSTREVELTGQAYFAVAHRSQTFIVHAGGMSIHDLGTEFNVNAYADEGARVRMTLVAGSVRVVSEGKGKVLIPGQQADALPGSLTITAPEDTREATAWRDGLFYFKSQDLHEQLRAVARWYDVDVRYEGNIDFTQRIIGNAPRNENLSHLIHMINLVGIHCKLVDRTIVIMP